MSQGIDQAVDRIVHLIRHEEDRKVVFLTGSGMSIPQVPSTADMIELFLDELGTAGNQLKPRLSTMSLSEQYQAAAEELKARRGDRGLSAAVKKAVLRALHPDRASALTNPDEITHADWALPPAQRVLGELAGRIPRQQLGAVITTNFDPLTEAAFEGSGVRIATLATPGNQAFPIESVLGVLPIIHLHGFWATTATLSTSMHLNTQRPNIERMLNRLLESSVLIVLGYGGWEDSFTRALSRMLEDGYMSSLETEIIWLQHSGPESVAAHPLLSKIQGEPGVNCYFHIGAQEVLGRVVEQLHTLDRANKITYPGWDGPPSEYGKPTRRQMVAYFNGAHPDWDISAMMPRLTNTRHVFDGLLRASENDDDAVILLSAPAGEGKTTALQQCAIDFASAHPESTVLLRRAGAPTITKEWIQHIRGASAQTIIFADDADLILDEVRAELSADQPASSGQLVWVLAAHSTYAKSQVANRLLSLVRSIVIEFRPITSDDVTDLSQLWVNERALPPSLTNKTADEVSALVQSDLGPASSEASLFGSMLGLWHGEGLRDRVNDLLSKLSRFEVAGVNFRYLLAAVAITQYAWGSQGEIEGISLAAFGRLAKVESEDVTRLIIRPLGREVGISQIGEKVFVRHPAIAEAVFEIFRESGELDGLVHEISRQGAVLRVDPDHTASDSNAAYRLARKLKGTAAVQAATGAIEGAADLLEPRVTLLATLRENDRADQASEYATALEKHLREYEDHRQTIRGFYVEWSVLEASRGHLDSALQLAIRSVSDEVDAHLQGKQLGYALNSIRRYAYRLSLANRPGAMELQNASKAVLGLLPPSLLQKGSPVIHRPLDSPAAIIGEFHAAANALSGVPSIGLTRMSRVLEPARRS